MKEFDENEAVTKMMESCEPATVNENDVCEVLDLIFDYYEENGELDIDAEGDEEIDTEDIALYVEKYLRKNGAPEAFTPEQIRSMIKAEIDYEDSLL